MLKQRWIVTSKISHRCDTNIQMGLFVTFTYFFLFGGRVAEDGNKRSSKKHEVSDISIQWREKYGTGLRDIRRWAMLDNEARTREMLKESCVYHLNRSPCILTVVVIKVIARNLLLSMIEVKLLDISKTFKYWLI